MEIQIVRSGAVPNQSDKKDGFIYIVKPDHANVYKIGETENLERRIIQLGKKFNFPIRYFFTCKIKNCFQIEQFLHLRYAKYHIGGDWFALTDSALSEVVSYLITLDSYGN